MRSMPIVLCMNVSIVSPKFCWPCGRDVSSCAWTAFMMLFNVTVCVVDVLGGCGGVCCVCCSVGLSMYIGFSPILDGVISRVLPLDGVVKNCG